MESKALLGSMVVHRIAHTTHLAPLLHTVSLPLRVHFACALRLHLHEPGHSVVFLGKGTYAGAHHHRHLASPGRSCRQPDGMTALSAFFQRPRHPPVHAAAPPQLNAGATAAFSVAAWRQEALKFQQQLDGLLLEQHLQAAGAAAPSAAAQEPAPGAGQAAVYLDASDLRLPTLQEEMICQLVNEQGAKQQQPQLPTGMVQQPLLQPDALPDALLPIAWDQTIASLSDLLPPADIFDATATPVTAGSGDQQLDKQQPVAPMLVEKPEQAAAEQPESGRLQQRAEQQQQQPAPVPAGEHETQPPPLEHQQQVEAAAALPPESQRQQGNAAPQEQQDQHPPSAAGQPSDAEQAQPLTQELGQEEQQEQQPADGSQQAPSPAVGQDRAGPVPGCAASGRPRRTRRAKVPDGSRATAGATVTSAAANGSWQQLAQQQPHPDSATTAAAAAFASAPLGFSWDASALLELLGPQHPLLLWPELGELLSLPPLLPPGQQAATVAPGGGWGWPSWGQPEAQKIRKRRKRAEEAQEMKPEKAALLEAYRQRAEAARQRRRDQHQFAARMLASIADSGLEPPLTWKLFQDGRSRQLQLVAQAAAEAAVGEACQGGHGAAPDGDRVGAEEVVLQVVLHVPHAPHLVSEEWLVLGSQHLTELRDRLFCVADKNASAMEKEENANRERLRQPPLRLSRPSAYFYVEGTFYNDLRQSGAADYSDPILRYNREHEIQAPPHPLPGTGRTDVLTTDFSAVRMEATRFEDLWLRLGSGAANLYCHQGGCEHLLTFQDVRLFDVDCDPPLRRQYPFRITPPQHLMMRDCEVCGARVAKRITYDDRAAPHTPFFWCEECFMFMHYDEQGAVLYTDFRVFPYTCEYPPSIIHKGVGANAPPR